MSKPVDLFLAAALLCLPASTLHATVLTNWARAGTASQESDGWGGGASRAIDGNISGNWADNTVAHTANASDNEWWEVDLKDTKPIGHIHLWFREGDAAFYPRSANLRVVIYDSTNTATRVVLWETNNVGLGDPPRDIGWDVTPVKNGRVVRVEHPIGIAEYLCLAEVEVFNQPLVDTINYARDINGGVATSSSVYIGDAATYGPQQANDGNHNGLTPGAPWGYSAPDATEGVDPLPWWQVELSAPQSIGSVVIWPRRDRTFARFEQIQLAVADASGNPLYQQVFAVQPSGTKFALNFVPALANGKTIKISTTANTPDKFLNLAEVEVFAPLASAPAITLVSNLQPVVAEQNHAARIGPVVAIADGGIRPEDISYRWYRNGVEMPGMAGSWLAALPLSMPALTNSADTYKVQVSVPGYGMFSSEVALTVYADTNAPAVTTNYATITDAFFMNLVFSELLNPTTATDPANYSLDGGPTLGAITLNADGKSVSVVVQNLLPGDSAALHVSGVKDLAGNPMAPGFFTAPYPSVAINYARTGTATASSAPYGGAANAIDGNTSGNNFAHTGNEDNAWWEVDLKAPKQIGMVKIYFRNGFNDRDKNIDLVILDDSTNRTELLRIPVSAENIPSNPSSITVSTAITGQIVRLEHPSGIAEYLCLSEVQVMPPPTGLIIAPNPINWTVFEGDRVILRSGASGQTPISTQWKLNGADIAGATGSELVITNISPANAGAYTFVATNATRSRASAPATVTVAPRPNLADSLVARYRFATDRIEIVSDDAPLNPAKTVMHDGTNTATWVTSVTDMNTPPVTRSGVLQFDGATFASISPHTDLDSRVGAIAFWMKGVAGPGNFSAIMFDRRGGPNNWGDCFGFSSDDTQNPAVGTLYCQNYSAQITLKGTKRVDDDNWHHIAYVYRYDPIGTMTFYIDGQLEAEKVDGVAGYWPETMDLRFGASRGWWSNLAGCMDDIHIFNRTLSPSEIAQVMSVGVPPELDVRMQGGQVVLTWGDSEYVIQHNSNLANPAGWADVTPMPTSPWSVPAPTSGNDCFRLRKR